MGRPPLPSEERERRRQESMRRGRQRYETAHREAGGRTYTVRLNADTTAAVADLAQQAGKTETEMLVALIERGLAEFGAGGRLGTLKNTQRGEI